MTDYLVRAITEAEHFRALACLSTGLVAEACRRHGTSLTASAALGRALTGGALMGALLKTGGRVALKLEGNGPLRKILVEADHNGAVRGYVAEPQADVPPRPDGKLDVAAGLGQAGFLTVAKDLGMREPYRGIVQLYTSEIAEDLAYYFSESEQIPSAVGLGVYLEPGGAVGAAGGFLVQALPAADPGATDGLIAQIGRMPPLTDLLREGKTPEEVLGLIFDGIPFRILEKHALAFRCSCSRERMERALLSLGREEIDSLIAELGEAVGTCEFCGERYQLSREELERLSRQLSAH
ncbi:MAG: Hsp33 family molecular chaperone HslO [Desulfobacteraceae bacterium]|nr:Hsp33 family molecular chaperone HslO [Desulfobacteraceae bacterium]